MGKTSKKTKPKSIFIGDPNVFKVDRILQQRKVGTKFEYFVKWSGYPDSENSWVSESDITPDLIETFKRKGKEVRSEDQKNAHNENDRRSDFYFEEGIHNMGLNVQMQSPSEDVRLFSE